MFETVNEPESELNLIEYLSMLRKHSMLITAITLFFVTLISLYLYFQPPRYQSQIKVLLEHSSPADAIWNQPVYFYSQKIIPEIEQEMILNTEIIGRVIRQLRLTDAVPYSPEWFFEVVTIKSYLSIRFQDSSNPNVYLGSRMLAEIYAETPTPQLSKVLLNELVEQYQLEQQEYKLDKDLKTKTWLDTQLIEAKTRIQEAERKFQEFKQEKKILSLDELQQSQISNYSLLEKDYQDAVRNKRSIEMKLEGLREAMGSDENSANIMFSSESPIIAKYVAELNDFKIELENASRTFKERHPQVLDINSKIQLSQQKIRKAKEDLLRSLRIQLESAQSFEQMKYSDMVNYKQKALAISNDALQYSLLEREVETTRQLYELLAKQLKETSVRTSINTITLRVVEPALDPIMPVSKRYPFKLFLAMVIGFFCGAAISFLIEFLDVSLKTPEDIKRYLDVPVVGMIPRIESDIDDKRLQEIHDMVLAHD